MPANLNTRNTRTRAVRLAAAVQEENELALFVEEQRSKYRRGTLSADHRAQLEALPLWTWEPVPEPDLSKMTDAQLQEYCDNARRKFHEGTLSPVRIAEFEAVPGWTWCGR